MAVREARLILMARSCQDTLQHIVYKPSGCGASG